MGLPVRAELVRTLWALLRYGKYMGFEGIRLWWGGVLCDYWAYHGVVCQLCSSKVPQCVS